MELVLVNWWMLLESNFVNVGATETRSVIMLTEERWESFVVSGEEAFLRDDYDEAEAELTFVLMLARQEASCLNSSIARLHCCLGDLYFQQRRYGDAENWYRKSLRLYDVLDSAGVDRAIVMKQLSEVERIQGNPIEAFRMGFLADKVMANRREKLEALLNCSPACT